MTPHRRHESPPPKTPSPPAPDGPSCRECAHCGYSYSGPWRRAVKRKAEDDSEASSGEGSGTGREIVPMWPPPSPPPADEYWNETLSAEDQVRALREEVEQQHRTIHELYEELEEERSASTTAANEAMTMMLRLQREKAEAVLEARQYKRFADERMEQDQSEISELEQEVRELSEELEGYRRRLEGLGVDDLMDSEPEEEVEEEEDDGARFLLGSLVMKEAKEDRGLASADRRREEVQPEQGVCESPARHLETGEIDKFESPSTSGVPAGSRAENEHIEQRVHIQEEEVERPATITAATGSDHEEVIISNSPHHLSRSSSSGSYVAVNPPHSSDDDSAVTIVENPVETAINPPITMICPAPQVRPESGGDSYDSPVRVMEIRGEDTAAINPPPTPFTNHAHHMRTKSAGPGPAPAPAPADESGDRVLHTIDAVHGVPLPDLHVHPVGNDSGTNSVAFSELDLKVLLLRLQALETDRDSLKKALSSMNADSSASSSGPSSQPISLWEAAQNSARASIHLALRQGKGLLKLRYLFWALTLMLPILKWVVPFLFYRRKKGDQIRTNQAGSSSNGGGLMLWLASKLLGSTQTRSLQYH